MIRGPLSAFSEVVDERRRWTADWYSWLTEFSTPVVKTVAGLPSPKIVGIGARAFATDATATTFHSVAVGGGANKVPVVSDGTNWLIG